MDRGVRTTGQVLKNLSNTKVFSKAQIMAVVDKLQRDASDGSFTHDEWIIIGFLLEWKRLKNAALSEDEVPDRLKTTAFVDGRVMFDADGFRLSCKPWR